ncbi:hypothetical protein AAC691_10250 [Nguyenibacter vanlangensis]|uniref:Uncharacterized protein n=1 Tax=Nguyenibacter vanlangensis TaxID=1216886 RepID=A0ABZ3DAF1_9PROT
MKRASFLAIALLAVSGCSHPIDRRDDPRAALFRNVGVPPFMGAPDETPNDARMHGQMTMGVTSSRGRGVVPMSSANVTNVLPGVSIGGASWGM